MLKTLAIGIAALGLSAPAAMAEWQPRKPIDFVIMAGPGGGADRIARFIQSVAEKKNMMSRPLIPNNKGGGSGAESLIWLNTANDPDHTILVTLNSFFTTPIRQPDLGIDIQTFTPIAMMGVDPFALWVHTDSGIETFEQWLEAVKAADGEYITGGTGTGQEDSIVFAYLDNAFDLKTKYIPFDGGGAVAAALAGKQIMATVNNPSEARGFHESGDVRPILVFSDEQMDIYPGVPALKEKGHDFSYYNQRAIVGAPGMSDEAAAFYVNLFTEVFNTEEWQNYLKTEAMSALWMNPEEQRAYWNLQMQVHKELLAGK
jgi:tripartite-type tricarboxylate transporter receptor subunit TctC